MDEKLSPLEEIADLAAKAVASDGAGELPYYLLGVEGYNRLIDLLVSLGKLSEGYLEEKTGPIEKKSRAPMESSPSPPIRRGEYTFRYSYEA